MTINIYESVIFFILYYISHGWNHAKIKKKKNKKNEEIIKRFLTMQICQSIFVYTYKIFRSINSELNKI